MTNYVSFLLTAYCEPCYTQLLQNELKQLLNYQSAKIYVRKIQNKYDDQPDTGADAEDDNFDETFNKVRSHLKLSRSSYYYDYFLI